MIIKLCANSFLWINQNWQALRYIYTNQRVIVLYFFVEMEKEEEQTNYRFPFQDEKGWKEHLQKEGFVVIANWIPKADCQQYVQDCWGIMETLADGTLDRNDPTTQVLSKNYPPVMHGGMIQYIGHSKPQWDLRKRAVPLFQKLWNAKHLKSSFDGFCFMNGARNYQDRPMNSFLHCDQAPIHRGVWSFQGIQTLTNSGQGEGGFVCCPKTNQLHQKWFKDHGMENEKKNWYKFSDKDKEEECFSNCMKVNSQAGDFILFDSRTFHCNMIPTKEVLRVCTYICMLPADHVPEKTQLMRELAVKNKRVSCHHPGNGFKTFAAQPQYLTDRNRFAELQNKVNSYELDEETKLII